MCGIVGFTGRREASPDPARRTAAARVPRLRQRRPDHRARATNCTCARRPAGSPNWASSSRRTPRRAATASATPAGPPTAARPTATPTRTSTRPATSPSSTTASSRTTPRSSTNSRPTASQFRSDTDTEVLAHLIAHYYHGDLLAAVRQALALVKGTYGLAVVCRHEPGVIVGARLGSPLVIGIGAGRPLPRVATPTPSPGYADKVVYLNDRQICQLDDDRLGHPQPGLRHGRRAGRTTSRHFLGDGDAEQGRLPALHAQGDLRAAGDARQRDARPARRRRLRPPTSAA